MNIAPAIYQILRNTAAITTIVADRIYPDILPQEEGYPALVHYTESKDSLAYTGGTVDTYKINVQIDIYFEVYANGKSLADSIRAALDKYTGTIGGVNIKSCYFSSETNNNFIEETKTYLITQSFLFTTYE